MPLSIHPNGQVFEVADSHRDHDRNANPLGLADYRCPAHARRTTYSVSIDRYDNFWVHGVYDDGHEHRVESYVITRMVYANAVYPSHVVIAAIREVDIGLARWINQPLYL